MASDEKENEKTAEPEAQSSGSDSKAPQGDTGAGTTGQTTEPPAASEPGRDTKQLASELDEGWPKSWIVTTAILGIVAIIIVARLVGQSWRKETPVPRPGPNPEAKAVPGKAGPQEPRVPGKAPVEKPGMGEQPAVAPTVLFEAADLRVPKGLHCVDLKNKKAQKLEDPYGRPDACVLRMGEKRWFRLEASGIEPPLEVNVAAMAPQGTDAPFFISLAAFPGKDVASWAGGHTIGTPVASTGISFMNPYDKEFVIKKLRVIAMNRIDNPPGKVMASLEAKDVVLPSPGHYCLTADGKAQPIKEGETPPETCIVKTERCHVYRLEVQRSRFDQGLRLVMRPGTKGVPPLMESFFYNRPIPEKDPDVLEGSIHGPVQSLALIFVVLDSNKEKVTLSSVKFRAWNVDAR